MTPREAAQKEAETTFDNFIVWTKKALWWIVACFILLTMCNFGVEDGKNKTGSQYNGDVYSPMNVGDN